MFKTRFIIYAAVAGLFMCASIVSYHRVNKDITIVPRPMELVKYQDLMKARRPEYDLNFKNPCWYEGNGGSRHLRCLPYFYLIGVKKCGTSYLFRRITEHPDFVPNSVEKEIHWFDGRRFKTPIEHHDNLDSYIQFFDKAARQIEELQKKGFRKKKGHKNWLITGEGTPAYLHKNLKWRYLPGNEHTMEPKYLTIDYIHHLLPDAKIIIVFRDPVKRLYSEYYHEFERLRHGRKVSPSPRHFHALITEGIRLYKDCFHHFTVRSCVYNETIYMNTKINIQLGMYYIYWQDLVRVFPREQIKIIHNKDMETFSTDALAEVFRFLGMHTLHQSNVESIAPVDDKVFTSVYSKVGGRMLNKTAAILKDFYQPFNRKMVEVTKDTRFIYDP